MMKLGVHGRATTKAGHTGCLTCGLRYAFNSCVTLTSAEQCAAQICPLPLVVYSKHTTAIRASGYRKKVIAHNELLRCSLFG